ncbi:MAG: ABC transporter ATP-binding protein [Clostridia bacterium]|nr:ABC transporter ATP-binding protein [Clostridia bacterium]
MEYAIETNGLTKHFKKTVALDGATLRVPKGAIYGLVGRNGAGKTTLIRVLCGLQRPSAGDYQLFGVPYTDKKVSAARRRTGALIERPAYYPEMTVLENLKQQCRILGMPSFAHLDEIIEAVGLSEYVKKRPSKLSLGYRQRLGIALALAGKPDLLLLDEPINSIDPQGIVEIRELLLRLNREHGVTMLISSHILDELSRLATDYGFLEKGKIIREMTAREFEANARKSMRVTVSDPAALAVALDEKGIEYKVLPENAVDIFAEIPVGELAALLRAGGCELMSVTERDETLESFFLNLTGAAK